MILRRAVPFVFVALAGVPVAHAADNGRPALRRATSKYLSHDVRYRAATAQVIAELMATLAEVERP